MLYDDLFVTTYRQAPQLPGILIGRLGVFHGALTLGSSLLAFPEGEARWDGAVLHFGGAAYEPGDTLTAGGGHTTVKRLRDAATPPGWPANGGVALVRREAAG